MNEVEKMYENAGVEAKNKCKSSQCIVTNPHPDWCNKCESLSKVYPTFTAEKQLELLKICFNKYERLEKVRGLKERCIIYYRFDTDGYTEFVNCETWEETIAALINDLWQDLTDTDKVQIKEILE